MLKDVFRKHPTYVEPFLIFLNRTCLDQISDNNGKAAFIWIVGQFGELIEDAPYILEKLIEDDVSSQIQKYLVVATTKLFFKRAPETHRILASLYSQILK